MQWRVQVHAHHVTPVSAMGPTAKGAIIELYSVPPVAFLPPLQSIIELAGCHTCTGVPPQFEDINPIGTFPPSAS